MRYYIDSSKYFRREELDGAFTLMNLHTNMTFSFAKAANVIFRRTDEWIEFDEFVDSVVTKWPREKVDDVFRKLLYKLNAGGLVQLEEVPTSNFTGIRQATKEDFYYLSEFCMNNYNKGLSCSEAFFAGYYGPQMIYEKIRNGEDSVIIAEEDGAIKAAVFFSKSKLYFGGVTIRIVSLIFDKNMGETEVTKAICDIIHHVEKAIEGVWNKIRYEYSSPRQDFIVSRLLKIGFNNTAIFEKEIQGNLDLKLYDKILPASI